MVKYQFMYSYHINDSSDCTRHIALPGLTIALIVLTIALIVLTIALITSTHHSDTSKLERTTLLLRIVQNSLLSTAPMPCASFSVTCLKFKQVQQSCNDTHALSSKNVPAWAKYWAPLACFIHLFVKGLNG